MLSYYKLLFLINFMASIEWLLVFYYFYFVLFNIHGCGLTVIILLLLIIFGRLIFFMFLCMFCYS
uniref:Putative ovule protein n=1 Tax=Solanum chacoense TaxID=4108 RepID=A0A0V0I0R4_SOLCH